MKNPLPRRLLVPVLALSCVAASTPQEEPPVEPPQEKSAVAARVNDFDITEADIDLRFKTLIAQQTRGQMLPPEQMAELRQSFYSQILEELITDHLLDEDVVKAGIEVSQEEVVAVLNRNLASQLRRSNMTREDFAQRIQQVEGITLEEFTKRQAADPALLQAVLHTRLLEQRFPEDVAVTEEQTKARYERDLESIYTSEAMVHARHILIGTDQLSAEEARAKAELVLVECRKPDADFAALAREHSTGPSAPDGGDLGFFPRQGVMVEAFAAAAFAMEVGEISDLVETQFGFHIIQVTEKREGQVVSFEIASAEIREELKFERIPELRERRAVELRKTATIEYTNAPEETVEEVKEG